VCLVVKLEKFRCVDGWFCLLAKKKKKNRLCVIGLAPAHVAFKDQGGITAVDFNVGKSDRSVIKVTGKRKKVMMLCVCVCVCVLTYI
jgi:hypothetical protein